MTNRVDARARPPDFIDIVQAVRIQNVLELAQIRSASVERCFPEQTCSIAGIADRRHPGGSPFRQLERAIVPDAGVVRIASYRQRYPCRKADRSVGHAIRKSDSFARD